VQKHSRIYAGFRVGIFKPHSQTTSIGGGKNV